MEKPVLTIDRDLRIPLSEFDFSFARAGGPGGQNVNKVSSKAILYWSVADSPSLPEDVRQRFLSTYGRRISKDGVLVVSSDRYRDQKRNVADCLEKVRAMLEAVAKPPKKRRPTKPSKAAKEKRLSEKRRVSEKKASRRKLDY